MDDFVIFGASKPQLWRVKMAVVEYLHTLSLQLHDEKSRIYCTEHGVPFLGFQIFPHRRRLLRGNVLRCKRRLRRLQSAHRAGRVAWPHVRQSIRSWIGHARHGDTARLREQMFADVVFVGKGG